MFVCSGNPYICWYLSVRWLGVLPNPRLAGGCGGSSSPSDLEPGSDLSVSGGGGGGARFTLLSVVGGGGKRALVLVMRHHHVQLWLTAPSGAGVTRLQWFRARLYPSDENRYMRNISFINIRRVKRAHFVIGQVRIKH